jgi:UPF0755 protein
LRRRVTTRGSAAVRLASAILVGLLALTCVVTYFLYQGQTDGEITDVILPRGSSLAQVSEILKTNGVIDQPHLFKILLRLTGGASRVRAGEFRFRKRMRAVDAFMVLYHDNPIVHHVTIPEGWTARQIADVLAREKLVDPKRFLDLTLTPVAAAKYSLPTPNLEGFLYPDTYDFSRIDGEERIIDRMVQHFLQVYNKDIKAQAQAQNMDLLTLITLASIVEKETGLDGERTLVSSVFHNRLKKKMRLQSDPTIIYGMGEAYVGKIGKKDILAYTPYNTYVIPGLPPGPICNPGEASLRATLNPAKSSYLYFVANNQGQHLFSETYEQHSRNVNTYQVLPFQRAKKRK